MLREEIKKIISDATGVSAEEFSVDVSANKAHGDYSTNIALIKAKELKKTPGEVLNLLREKISKKDFYSDIRIAGPGFINFYLSEKYLQDQVKKILKEKNNYGNGEKKKEKINVEFISANPTGPLTLGNGRGGFCGDVLSNVLKKSGYEVCKEYYINDTGNQIKVLGHSVLGDAEAVYKGNYIEELREKIKGKTTEEVGEKAAKEILEKMIKPSVKKMGIEFDNWFSENNLYKDGEVDEVIKELKNKNFTYESEGAVWFKSKDLGDDKDRVLIRADGIRTYFASDVAYLKNKFNRKFDKLIFFVGADHHGYVTRIMAAAEALGYDKNKIAVIVMQLVKLFENGKEAKMSKRAGTYVTINELIDEVGLDIARFFFLQITPNTHMNFNLNLAKEKSEKNPVFKIQYAHARICSILKKSPRFIFGFPDFKLLEHKSELNLIKELLKFPEIIEDSAKDFQLQRLPQYAIDLADAFHKFYENCKVISEDKNLTNARLALSKATKITLKNTLDLMGISVPEKM
jgi:arginyl-tRNA synthetase